MLLTFNMLIREVDISPAEVRLLRHHHVTADGLTPYALWRDARTDFERYQSAQRSDRRTHFLAPYWASFVASPDGGTIFAGLYRVGDHRPAELDWLDPLERKTAQQLGIELDIYDCARVEEFEELTGRLKIEWGKGARTWVQRADSPTGNKPILEVATSYQEPAFPGYTSFMGNLGSLLSLPYSWLTALSAARGIYLLTCPKTREQYVGSASGSDGFWGRWQSYIADGHGGNIGLKSREPSDYQVSILEVAGSAASIQDILEMEALWKAKLQSRDMGLNRN